MLRVFLYHYFNKIKHNNLYVCFSNIYSQTPTQCHYSQQFLFTDLHGCKVRVWLYVFSCHYTVLPLSYCRPYGAITSYVQVLFLNVFKLKPLYKQRDKISMTNYRSISLLTVFSKELEQLIKQAPAHKQHTGHRTVQL